MSRVLAVSEECAAFFAARVRYPAARVVISRNGVDFSHFRETARDRQGFIDLLYISRLDRDKRAAVEAVMAAVARLFAEQPRVRLRILGDGRQLGRINKKARALNSALGRDVIAVEGWANDMAGPLAKAAVVLGVGRCVLEAIASGRPALVVGSDRIGGLVTTGNFLALQKTNFSGRGSAAATSP